MGIIKDVWDITKDISKSTVNRRLELWKSKKRQKEILFNFAPDFAKHDEYITHLLDYYSWHEKPSDWKSGSGRLLTVTHKEILKLWTRANIAAPYEAFLLRHMWDGGTISRIFVLGTEYFDPKTRLLLLSVLYRHHILGFDPRVTSVIDLKTVSKSLSVECDMFGVFNDYIAYYFSFPENSDPFFIRTVEPIFVGKATKCHNELIVCSNSFESWYKNQPLRLEESDKKEVELECELIHEIARYRGNDHV